MIRLLIVDDAKVIQEYLYHIFSSDSEIQIVGVASSGNEALELVKLHEPDVITMDIHMPGMDGYETTYKIMNDFPTPIVIVSGSLTIRDEVNIFKSLEAGALAVVQRPEGIGNPKSETSVNELIRTVKLMSKVKITRLFQPNRKIQIEEKEQFSFVPPFQNYLKRIEVIAIGASTGGPIALQKILSRLPGDLPVPVLIVQHISAGFARALTEWLSITSGIKLKLAVNGETIIDGTGYIAPDHYHMEVGPGRKIRLNSKGAETAIKPSINNLFRSVAQIYGLNAFGVLLTGIGNDGAEALKYMKGALTLVQDEGSSIVFDLPGEALKIGAADLSFSPERIADFLAKTGKIQ
jgi:two-component system chemotaxis response regulator CheB